MPDVDYTARIRPGGRCCYGGLVHRAEAHHAIDIQTGDEADRAAAPSCLVTSWFLDGTPLMAPDGEPLPVSTPITCMLCMQMDLP